MARLDRGDVILAVERIGRVWSRRRGAVLGRDVWDVVEHERPGILLDAAAPRDLDGVFVLGARVAARTRTAIGVIDRAGVICIETPVMSSAAEAPVASSVNAESIHAAMSRAPTASPAARRSLYRSSRIAAALG